MDTFAREMADIATSSVSLVAVTAAVGAVVLLLVLLFGIGRNKDEKKEKEGNWLLLGRC